MSRTRAFARALPSLVALLLAAPLGCASEEGPPGEPPTLYKWVDRNGVAHYTTDPDRIPSNLRHRIRDLEDQPRMASRPPGEPGGEPSAGQDPMSPAPAAAASDGAREAAGAEPTREARPASRASAAPASEGRRADGPGTETPAAQTTAAEEPGAEAPRTAEAPAAAAGAPGAAPADAPAPTASAPSTPREAGEDVTRPALREAPEPTTRGAPQVAAREPGRPEARRGAGEPAERGDAGAGAAPGEAGGGEASPASRGRRAELDARIAELEAELEAKEERLKALISETQAPADGAPAPLYDNEELESLARSFPKLQADLAALRAERRRLERGR